MNLVLLDPADFIAGGRVVLQGRRHAHLRQVVKVAPGEPLRVGLLGGKLGTGTVLAIDDQQIELAVELVDDPPPPLPITMLLALPRPHSLRKVLQQATAMGVKRFVLFACARVEPSFFTASAIRPAAIDEDLRLGLEQARDTVLPQVEVHAQRFHRFLGERWSELASGQVLIAHPEPGASPCPRAVAGPVTLVVGPEGGFVPAEVDRLRELGTLVDLGPRILRVETAVVALLARLG
ncbi:MAG: 16S rRNA (uracil(1498)-N(3))-methyltransferase [Nannocystis sp.]|nr:16S rRNA (uracil(1498)-N(3))-methyltransferase [Nannocystis sp.]MBA3547820.1 16S rRNA (uracil(1498)-N(3))-methyltransferase [Nannocystis sp.]